MSKCKKHTKSTYINYTAQLPPRQKPASTDKCKQANKQTSQQTNAQRKKDVSKQINKQSNKQKCKQRKKQANLKMQ